MFEGSFVAIVTPFKDGTLDEEALANLINWHIKSGTHGIVACGTTGESPTLSNEEHRKVIEFCVDVADKRIPVIAGTGSNCTSEAVAMTAHAKQVGADGALLVNPYYNKPTQEGIYQHYTAIATAVDLPQIIYNIPGRTSSTVSVETVARLSAHKNIIGVKDAVGDLNQTSRLISACGDRFVVLSGDDSLTLPMMALGGKGVISTTANIIPSAMAKLVTSALQGDWVTARKIHYANIEIMNVMFCETNPIPVKTALALMGKIDDDLRLPLCPISGANRERLADVIRSAGLLRSGERRWLR